MNVIITERLDPIMGLTSDLNLIEKILSIMTIDEFKLISSAFLFFFFIICNMSLPRKWNASYLSFKGLRNEQRALRTVFLITQVYLVPHMFALYHNQPHQEQITMHEVNLTQLNTLCPVWSIRVKRQNSMSQCLESNGEVETYQWLLPRVWRSVNVLRLALDKCDHQRCLKITVTDLDMFMELVAPKELESMLNELSNEFSRRVVHNRERIDEIKAESDSNRDKWERHLQDCDAESPNNCVSSNE